MSLVALKKKKSLNQATKSLSWQHCAHLYYSPLSQSDCSSTRIFRRTHTYRNIWTTPNQRGWVHPSLSLIGLDHDMGLMCVCCWTTGRLSESRRLFFFRERLVAQVRPLIFVSRTLENLGRTCDQIGSTLEPCSTLYFNLLNVCTVVCMYQMTKLQCFY